MASPQIAEDRKDYKDNPQGLYRRWKLELDASEKEQKSWHKDGDDVIRVYLLKNPTNAAGTNAKGKKLALFSSNVDIKQAIFYGKIPTVDVERRFQDSSDEDARIVAEVLKRTLNNDIERASDSFVEATKHAVQDRLMPGLGVVRFRYVASFRKVQEPAITEPAEEGVESAQEGQPMPEGGGNAAPQSEPGEAQPQELAGAVEDEEKVDEDIETDYVYWKDFRYNAGLRVPSEMRWGAFRAQMSKEQVEERFGKKIAAKVLYNSQRDNRDEGQDDEQGLNPWARADIWEIWSKEDRKVYWFNDGYGRILDSQDDPYQLEGFWPFPKPLIAHTTTTAWVPRNDYNFAKDLYEAIDTGTTRIALLVKAVRVVGLYDGTQESLQRLLSEANENEMVAVDNWAMFAEKGGIKGVIDWFPLEQIAAVLTSVREDRQENIQLLWQVTGMSDILRGQQTENGTPGEAALKMRAASVYMQQMQDEVANFVSEGQRIRAEMMAQLFDPETLLRRSNILHTPDAEKALPALGRLLRDSSRHFRISVKPESVSLTDFAQLKSERVDAVEGLAKMLQTATPLMQQAPASAPLVLEMVKWFMAGFRGFSSIEGVLDRAIDQAGKGGFGGAQQAPDPVAVEKAKGQVKLQIEQQKAELKAKADMAHQQAEDQAVQQRNQVELAADEQARQQDFQLDMAQLQEKHRLDMETLQAKHALELHKQQEAHEQGLKQQREAHQQNIAALKARPKPTPGKKV